MTIPPNYDIDFRFRRALNPEGLSTIQTCTAAIGEAVIDARNAGLNPEEDAGVLLLSRHLGRIAGGQNPDTRVPEDDGLRDRCFAHLAALLRAPTIVVLVRRGLTEDPVARTRFIAEAKSCLLALACAIGLSEAEFTVSRSTSACCIELSAADFNVRIDGLAEGGREVAAMSGRAHHYRWSGATFNHDIGVLLDIPRFARTLRRELRLSAPTTPRQAALV